jgi:carbamate kinase
VTARRIVVALGGNALLRRGEALTARAQQATIATAAGLLASVVAGGDRLVVTHGNGPQVGLLALQSAAGPASGVLPLDALGAASEGWVGYALELGLRDALPTGAELVTILTQTVVDRADPGFAAPVKPIGPVYADAEAHRLATELGWTVAADGKGWRRVVASPAPLRIVEIATIARLVDAGVIVICAGGGGIPVVEAKDGALEGIEAVIDKDAASALLATALAADLLVMLTDVAGVFLDHGTDRQRLIQSASPASLAPHTASFRAGSMGPKVAAACAFAEATGNRAVIGALADCAGLITGLAGTTIGRDLDLVMNEA